MKDRPLFGIHAELTTRSGLLKASTGFHVKYEDLMTSFYSRHPEPKNIFSDHDPVCSLSGSELKEKPTHNDDVITSSSLWLQINQRWREWVELVTPGHGGSCQRSAFSVNNTSEGTFYQFVYVSGTCLPAENTGGLSDKKQDASWLAC